VILDMVGGDYLERNIIAAAQDARIVQIATQAARAPPSTCAASCRSA
jgi:NADPH:quinone reductase-like Zn-dependent oxidoreductase